MSYPSCPHCGNLCGRLARVCHDCGAHLYDDVTNDGRAKKHANGWKPGPHGAQDCYPVGLRNDELTHDVLAKIAAQLREDSSPIKEREDSP